MVEYDIRDSMGIVDITCLELNSTLALMPVVCIVSRLVLLSCLTKYCVQ